jgi:type IV fimbrial biogenesis protein FimT
MNFGYRAITIAELRAPTRQHGFSLIELLVTLGVLAILLVAAAPAMTGMILNNRMSSYSNDLMADLAIARSEALKRNQRIVICKNSDNNSSCGTGNWQAGWLLYLDADSDTVLDAGETILRVRQALPGGYTINSAGIVDTLVVRPVGLSTPTGTFRICDQRAGNFGRLITISAAGRASVAPATCP